MSKIFISGPSGVGKTTLGEELTKRYGWLHIDCEKMHIEHKAKWMSNPMNFIPKSNNLVLTWGLVSSTFLIAEKIIDTGLFYVWLDGEQKYIDDSLKNRGETQTFIDNPKRKNMKINLTKRNPDLIINAFEKDGTRIDTASIIHERFWTPPFNKLLGLENDLNKDST